MNELPNLILAPGMSLVVHPDGRQEVVQSSEPLSKTVSFRVSTSEYVAMLPFFEAFPDARQTTAIRWLLAHPEVRLVMAQRVADSRIPAPSPSVDTSP